MVKYSENKLSNDVVITVFTCEGGDSNPKDMLDETISAYVEGLPHSEYKIIQSEDLHTRVVVHKYNNLTFNPYRNQPLANV